MGTCLCMCCDIVCYHMCQSVVVLSQCAEVWYVGWLNSWYVVVVLCLVGVLCVVCVIHILHGVWCGGLSNHIMCISVFGVSQYGGVLLYNMLVCVASVVDHNTCVGNNCVHVFGVA